MSRVTLLIFWGHDSCGEFRIDHTIPPHLLPEKLHFLIFTLLVPFFYCRCPVFTGPGAAPDWIPVNERQ
jgi:hypothetical protein